MKREIHYLKPLILSMELISPSFIKIDLIILIFFGTVNIRNNNVKRNIDELETLLNHLF